MWEEPGVALCRGPSIEKFNGDFFEVDLFVRTYPQKCFVAFINC